MNSHIIKYTSTSIFIFGPPIPCLYIYWVFVTDYTKYFSGKIGSIALRKMTLKEHFSFGFYKVGSCSCFCGHTYLYGWVYTVDHWISEYGHGYRICFEHSIPVSPYQWSIHIFRLPDAATGKMEDEWAIHQVKTTANFATKIN